MQEAQLNKTSEQRRLQTTKPLGYQQQSRSQVNITAVTQGTVNWWGLKRFWHAMSCQQIQLTTTTNYDEMKRKPS